MQRQCFGIYTATGISNRDSFSIVIRCYFAYSLCYLHSTCPICAILFNYEHDSCILSLQRLKVICLFKISPFLPTDTIACGGARDGVTSIQNAPLQWTPSSGTFIFNFRSSHRCRLGRNEAPGDPGLIPLFGSVYTSGGKMSRYYGQWRTYFKISKSSSTRSSYLRQDFVQLIVPSSVVMFHIILTQISTWNLLQGGPWSMEPPSIFQRAMCKFRTLLWFNKSLFLQSLYNFQVRLKCGAQRP